MTTKSMACGLEDWNSSGLMDGSAVGSQETEDSNILAASRPPRPLRARVLYVADSVSDLSKLVVLHVGSADIAAQHLSPT
jgi:hypothetical protein